VRIIVLVLCSVLPSAGQMASDGGLFTVVGDMFSAVGKWIPSDPKVKPAYPEETQIDCFKNSMTCVEATADYYVGHPHVTIRYLVVNKWDKDSLVASGGGTCMTYMVLVSFAEKTLNASYALKQLPEKQRDSCKSLGALKTEMTFVLRNSERWNKEREQEWLHPRNY
jgi:coproporphyrinogen III oxidase